MDIWIAAINTGHNASTCLLKNGELVFYIEEDRLSRVKYEGEPFAGLDLIRKYTPKLDKLLIHDFNIGSSVKTHFNESIWICYARKIGLIDRQSKLHPFHPQIELIDEHHHSFHANHAFLNSGFDEAVVIVCDGGGSEHKFGDVKASEYETVYYFTNKEKYTVLKRNLLLSTDDSLSLFDEVNRAYYTNGFNICKTYQTMVEYCGFNFLEAGKAMGLAAYGQPDSETPVIFSGQYPEYRHSTDFFNYVKLRWVLSEQVYKHVSVEKRLYFHLYEPITTCRAIQDSTITQQQNLAYVTQKACEKMFLDMINWSIANSNCKNIVITGGFGLNCSANYQYRKQLPSDVKLFCEPISHDGGTTIGIARAYWLDNYGSINSSTKLPDLYLGPVQPLTYQLNPEEQEFNADTSNIVDLLLDQKLVCIFQSRSEAGPRALGNRSILFDPRVPNGKDIVNQVKKREWFRPFAGSILLEHVHDWFDMAGLEESPYMMYAVDTLQHKQHLIPSIVHVDGTCRIQTVTRNQNKHFYDLIEKFYQETSVPILFNTSFNLAGDPLVETMEDALHTLRNSELEWLYIPEIQKLIHVPNKLSIDSSTS